MGCTSSHQPDARVSAQSFALAVSRGRLDDASTILESCPALATVPADDLPGLSPLRSTIEVGALCLLHKLLRQGAELNVASPNGDYPVHVALRSGRVDVVQLLLSCGCDFSRPGALQETGLHCAASSGDDKLLALLLHTAATGLRPPLPRKVREAVRSDARSHASQPWVIKRLSARSKTAPDPRKLKRAASMSSPSSARAARQSESSGMTVTKARLAGPTAPLSPARLVCVRRTSSASSASSASYLDAEKFMSVLQVSSLAEDSKTQLKKPAAICNARNHLGQTPLYLAAARGFVSTCRILLQAGASPTIAAQDGSTPLHAAARAGAVAVVTALLRASGASSTTGLPSADALAVSRPASLPSKPTHRRRHHRRHHASAGVASALTSPSFVNVRDTFGNTALHYACRFGSEQVVSVLLRNGADVRVVDSAGNAPIVVAASRSPPAVICALLSGPHTHEQETLAKAVHVAASSGSADTLSAILSLTQPRSGPLFHHSPPQSPTVALRAPAVTVASESGESTSPLRTGSLRRVRGVPRMRSASGHRIAVLSAHPTSLVHRSVVGSTPSSPQERREGGGSAMEAFSVPAPGSVLANSAEERRFWSSPSVAPEPGMAALDLAAAPRGGEPGAAVELGVTHPLVHEYNEQGVQPLHAAVSAGRVEAVRVLLRYGADPTAREPGWGRTPLILAAVGNWAAVAQVLLKKGRRRRPTCATEGSDRSSSNSRHGGSGRHAVTSTVSGRVASRQYSLASLADSEHSEMGGDRSVVSLGSIVPSVGARQQQALRDWVMWFPPIMWAVLYGADDVLACMLSHGCNVHTLDRAGRTALHWASQQGKSKLVRLLVEHGAVVSQRDCIGRTPLHYAARWGQNSDAISVLLAWGADPRQTTQHNEDARALAIASGCEEAVQVCAAAACEARPCED